MNERSEVTGLVKNKSQTVPLRSVTLHSHDAFQLSRSVHRTCSSAVGGYCPGLREGLAGATGAPFDGTSDAIPAAADTGLAEAAGPRDSAPPLAAVELFTSVLVPGRDTEGGVAGTQARVGETRVVTAMEV